MNEISQGAESRNTILVASLENIEGRRGKEEEAVE